MSSVITLIFLLFRKREGNTEGGVKESGDGEEEEEQGAGREGGAQGAGRGAGGQGAGRGQGSSKEEEEGKAK